MKIIINSSLMVPIYEQIVDQIKTLIRNGELKENDNLPSVRVLSRELKISALTVKKAYDELESEGFTVTVHGKGTYVAATNTQLLLEEQKKEVAILTGGKESFSQFRLDYYSDYTDSKYGASPRTIMERNFQNCRRYAMSFSAASGNLLFVGGTGLGKTFLSACIARAVADRGFGVVYETAGHLFSNMEQAKFGGGEEARKEIQKYNDCDLLILDDLGTEMPGQFVTAALYGLLNDRILYNKPMVISTNLNVEEISRRYSPQIASRLHGSFNRLTFVGEDIRVMKNRGL